MQRINKTPEGKSWLAGELVEGTHGHLTWDSMRSEALKTLVSHAQGRVHHVNMGECPNEIDGFTNRDIDCPVCSAVLGMEAE